MPYKSTLSEEEKHIGRRSFWALLVVGLVLRIVLMALYPGHLGDITFFKTNAKALAEGGLWGFYKGTSTEFPGLLYLLWPIGLIQRALQMNDTTLLVVLKTPAVIADVLSALVIRRLIRYFASERIAIALAGAYLFNPGIIFSSAIWGQVDSAAACLALLATSLLVGGKTTTSVAVFAAALLVKTQLAPLGPILGVFIVRHFATSTVNSSPSRQQVRWDVVAASVFAGIASITIAIIPFGLSWLGFVRLLFKGVNKTPYSSANAFNLWGMIQGLWQPDTMRLLGVPASAWGGLLFALSLLGLMAILWRYPDFQTLLLVSGTTLAAGFLFVTRSHERYLLYSLAFLAVAPAFDRRTIGPYLIFSITFLLNMVYVYRNEYLHTLFMPSWMEGVLFENIGTRLLGAINLVAFAWLAWIVVHKVPGGSGQTIDRPLSPTDPDSTGRDVPLRRPPLPRWLTWTIVASLFLLWSVYFEFPSAVAWRIGKTRSFSESRSVIVDVSGSTRLLSGRLDGVYIRMRGVEVGDLPADEISLRLHNLVFDVPRLLVRNEWVVSRMGAGDGVIVFGKKNLQDFLASAWGVQNPVVTLENDVVIIEGDARALAFSPRSSGPRDPAAPLPSARLEGRLIVTSPTAVGLEVRSLTLIGPVVPPDLRNAPKSGLHPLITLRDLPVPARIQSVAVREGTIRLMVLVGSP